MIYGYARVSTGGQSTAGQVAELRAAGCEKVVQEVASGAGRRLWLERLVRALEPGDVLMVTRLDRIARTSLGLLQVLDKVASQGAAFRSLVDHWADTSTPHGKLLMAVLSGLAEFERDLLLKRTSEGRRAARERGVKLGRKFCLTEVQRAWCAVQKRDGMTSLELSRLFNVHRSTISRIPPAAPGVYPPFRPQDASDMGDGTGGGPEITKALDALVGQPFGPELWAKLVELGCPRATGDYIDPFA